jgi:FAD/FMN-containing dehydrogenase
MPLPFRSERLTGWGRHPVEEGRVLRPERYRDLARPEAACLPRGLGRSYGDAALNAGGPVLSTARLDRLIAFDSASGLLEAEGGVTFDRILRTFLPRGWFLPVTPGTRFVTLGGALAADVHGKNHHVDGALGRHVTALELFAPDGERRWCGPEENADVFHATLGGMGLTGTLGAASLRLLPVESPAMVVRHAGAKDLEASFRLLAEQAPEDRYTVAWIDGLAKGASLGRSVFMAGRHARKGELGAPGLEGASLREPRFALPFDLPGFTLNRASVGLFNALYFHSQSRKTKPFLSSLDAFFYPLDAVRDWNRMYGADGFVQYQCVLPEGTAFDGMKALLELISGGGQASFLAVLKRFGPGGEGPLSFPMEGFTLALDLPFRGEATLALLAKLDARVLRDGGRVYLAKDAHLAPEAFRAMYPRFGEWFDVKQRLDPEWRVQSSLSRRLRMEAGP